MGRYRKIDTRIWNDAKFVSLSKDAKLVFLFILTHPHLTSLGAMRATTAGLASELGWPAEGFRKAFAEAFGKGMIEHDEASAFVGVPNFLRYNGPESPNVVVSWRDSLDLIPECRLKDVLIQRVKGFVEGLSERFLEALPEGFKKGMPNQEPEPEPEPEPDKNSCGEPCENGGCVVMEFPVTGKGPALWPLFESKVAEYSETFLGVDVLAECKRARQWCIDNPSNRKTYRGMTSFLNKWLTKEQNKSHPTGLPPGRRQSKLDPRLFGASP